MAEYSVVQVAHTAALSLRTQLQSLSTCIERLHGQLFQLMASTAQKGCNGKASVEQVKRG